MRSITVVVGNFSYQKKFAKTYRKFRQLFWAMTETALKLSELTN